MSDGVRRVGGAVLWLLVVVAIALGAAGLATATPSAVASAARPELTGMEDVAVSGRLDAVERDLGRLATRVDALGAQARGALSALVGGNTEKAAAAIAAGDASIAEIGVQAALVQAGLAATPFVGTVAADLHLSPAVQERYARLRDGLDATRGLDSSWAGFTSGAVSATRLSASLAEHDRLVGVAAERGRAAKYKEALTFLALAAEEIKTSRTLRTQLANTVDVTVLDQWLERNESYDKALHDLYVEQPKVGDRVTDKVRKAIAAELAARTRLPPDSRGLIIIIAEIGRGGMNGAVIAIEEAKARLADALAPSTSAGPADAPDAGPSDVP